MYKDFKDYYSALEIGFDASDATIKAAYRKMARTYHPDLHPDETDYYTGLFQEVTEAYETLSDPERKASYDYRYRQMVLGEGPQYEYYVDDTPEDTTVYQHKYTHTGKNKIWAIRILIIALVTFQLFRAVSQTAEVEPDTSYRRPLMRTPVSQPDSKGIQYLLEHSSTTDPGSVPKDSLLFTPVTHP